MWKRHLHGRQTGGGGGGTFADKSTESIGGIAASLDGTAL